MSRSATTCRWGVIGTAGIARKVVRGMQRARHASPVAIASRTLDRAAAFAEEHGLDRAHGSYEAMLADPEIDADYVPRPTGVRREVVIEAARAGKHVLCEKPVAPHVGAAEEMIEACADAGVQFMDGVMFMHHLRMAEVEARLDRIGTMPTLVESAFTFKADDSFLEGNIRTSSETEPSAASAISAGTPRDRARRHGLPVVVRARHHRMHGGVPIHTSGELEFRGLDGPRLAGSRLVLPSPPAVGRDRRRRGLHPDARLRDRQPHGGGDRDRDRVDPDRGDAAHRTRERVVVSDCT